MAVARSWRGLLGRAVLYLAAAFLVVSVASVAALRYVDPPVSAVMGEATLEATMAGDRKFVLQHRWVDLDLISPIWLSRSSPPRIRSFPSTAASRGGHRERL